MTHWRDGMGRITIKTYTGRATRGQAVFAGAICVGLCRAPGWVQIYGPADIPCVDLTPTMLQQQRERMAARARRQRLPSAARYNPANDLRQGEHQ